jgi:hypothetical protein
MQHDVAGGGFSVPLPLLPRKLCGFITARAHYHDILPEVKPS